MKLNWVSLIEEYPKAMDAFCLYAFECDLERLSMGTDTDKQRRT